MIPAAGGQRGNGEKDAEGLAREGSGKLNLLDFILIVIVRTVYAIMSMRLRL